MIKIPPLFFSALIFLNKAIIYRDARTYQVSGSYSLHSSYRNPITYTAKLPNQKNLHSLCKFLDAEIALHPIFFDHSRN